MTTRKIKERVCGNLGDTLELKFIFLDISNVFDKHDHIRAARIRHVSVDKQNCLQKMLYSTLFLFLKALFFS